MSDEPFDAELTPGFSSAGRFISRICCSTTLTIAGESSTSAWMEKRADSRFRKPGMPSSPKEKDSRGLPRYGGSNAALSVGLTAIRDRSWSASRKLLFPAPLGPNRTTSGWRSTWTSTRDLYPLISIRLSIPAPHPGDVVAELGAKVLTAPDLQHLLYSNTKH